MLNNSLSIVSVLLAAFVPMVALILAGLLERRRRRLHEKPPQEEKLLRPPGYSLALRLETTQDAILDTILSACLFSGLAGASALAFVGFLALPVARAWAVIPGVLLAVFVAPAVMASLRAFRRFREAQNLRLGIRGEQAVAETLHEVGDKGFRAFHDLPGGANWNIDHVVVGSRGVFLIETKARRRRASRNGKPEHVVVYDGNVLRFPSGVDTRAIPQAQRNACWLAGFLTKKTGEPVTVESVVVVPGWYVETKGHFPVKAMNATYLSGFLRGQSDKLPAAQVRRIVTALDEKCRDVEF